MRSIFFTGKLKLLATLSLSTNYLSFWRINRSDPVSSHATLPYAPVDHIEGLKSQIG